MARRKRRRRPARFPSATSESEDVFVGQTGNLDDQCIAITASGQRCTKNSTGEGPNGPVCQIHFNSKATSKTIRTVKYPSLKRQGNRPSVTGRSPSKAVQNKVSHTEKQLKEIARSLNKITNQAKDGRLLPIGTIVQIRSIQRNLDQVIHTVGNDSAREIEFQRAS